MFQKIFKWMLIILTVGFISCLDKSYNNHEKGLGLICLNVLQNPSLPKSERDLTAALCFKAVESEHQRRISKENGVECGRCHKMK